MGVTPSRLAPGCVLSGNFPGLASSQPEATMAMAARSGRAKRWRLKVDLFSRISRPPAVNRNTSSEFDRFLEGLRTKGATIRQHTGAHRENVHDRNRVGPLTDLLRTRSVPCHPSPKGDFGTTPWRYFDDRNRVLKQCQSVRFVAVGNGGFPLGCRIGTGRSRIASVDQPARGFWISLAGSSIIRYRARRGHETMAHQIRRLSRSFRLRMSASRPRPTQDSRGRVSLKEASRNDPYPKNQSNWKRSPG